MMQHALTKTFGQPAAWQPIVWKPTLSTPAKINLIEALCAVLRKHPILAFAAGFVGAPTMLFGLVFLGTSLITLPLSLLLGWI